MSNRIMDCKLLGDLVHVFGMFQNVEYLTIVYKGGAVEFKRGIDAEQFCFAYQSEPVQWRIGYGLCSVGPTGTDDIIAFIVKPRDPVLNAGPTNPAALAKRFRKATPEEMRG